MTSTEKSALFAFLDTAERWLSNDGQPGSTCPAFSDDIEPAIPLCRGKGCTASALSADVMGRDIAVMVIVDQMGPTDSQANLLLDKMLNAIQLSRCGNCFYTGIVQCASDGNTPDSEVFEECLHNLDIQIGQLKPAVILALGHTTAQILLDTDGDMDSLRGRFWEYRGIPLLVSFKPEAILGDETLKRPAWEDLKKIRSELDRITG